MAAAKKHLRLPSDKSNGQKAGDNCKKTAVAKSAPKGPKTAKGTAESHGYHGTENRVLDEVVFEARDLRIHAVRDNGGELPIVKGVDFKVRRGEVVALIGESGSGKTTISLSALGYCKPGRNSPAVKHACSMIILSASRQKICALRGEKVAYLAQSAATATTSIRLTNRSPKPLCCTAPRPVKKLMKRHLRSIMRWNCPIRKQSVTVIRTRFRWLAAASDGDGTVW